MPAARAAPQNAQRIQTYRRFHRFFIGVVALIIASVLIVRLLPSASSDHRKFDQKRWTAVHVVDGDSFELADSDKTRVVLLGVDAPELPDSHYAAAAYAYLRGRIEGKVVLLRLDGTQTRDSNGRLLAYVYITDTDLLNADIIRDGRAYSDRRRKHTFRAQFDQTESEARTKARGLWDEITEDRMPPWRRAWLKTTRNAG